MNIGILKITLRLSAAHSLKEKRRIVKSLIERLRSHYAVSVAEVGALDQWQRALIGIAYVNNDTRHTRRIMDKIEDFIASMSGEYEVIDQQGEIISGL